MPRLTAQQKEILLERSDAQNEWDAAGERLSKAEKAIQEYSPEMDDEWVGRRAAGSCMGLVSLAVLTLGTAAGADYAITHNMQMNPPEFEYLVGGSLVFWGSIFKLFGVKLSHWIEHSTEINVREKLPFED